MPDFLPAPVSWAAATAVATAILWVVAREARVLQSGRGRNVRDILDIALPVVAIGLLAHGFLRPDARDQHVANQEPMVEQDATTQDMYAPQPTPFAEGVPENPLLAGDAGTADPDFPSDAELIAGALAAFQRAAQPDRPALAVQTAPAVTSTPGPSVAVATPSSPATPARPSQNAADQKVITVLPVGGKSNGTARSDGTGVVVTPEGTGVIVAKKGPVIVTRHYENPAFRAIRSCPDESCEIIANLSRYAPLTRTGKRHPQGLAQRAWVEVRSSGPHCKRYDSASMVGACLEWERSPVTGWTLDPNLIR
jgi:hypothetical protein